MRTSWVLALVICAGSARADDASEVALAAELGAVGGGGATPGGLRVGGRFLYRMADVDWFDGAVAFTFGDPRAACGRVAPTGMSCDHGVGDGFAGDLALGVRRELGGPAGFVPFIRGAVVARVVRFAGDDVSGGAVGGEVGVGLRARLRDGVSLTGGATGFAGVARLGGGVGSVGQLGLTIGAGAEFRMR
ncbi:MAG: hypothetical protein R3B06_20600 [Kofleriaceae bacterium]